MQKFWMFLGVLLMSFSLGAIDAEAKRMGGGRSMGMQRSIEAPSRPATPPSVAPGAPARAAPGMAPQAPRRGFGWGGALAGLAAGGLLGALLFGGGFDNINFFDIAVLLGIALVVFLIVRAMRRKHSPASQGQQGMAYAGMDNQPAYQPQHGVLEPAQAGAAYGGGITGSRPAGFEEGEFLHGAKAAFNRLQADWDARDLNDLRRFTTPEMYGELSAQIQEQGDERNVTEVLSLDAQLLDMSEEADRWVASVRYDGMMREQLGGNPERVTETWHFIRPKNAQGPTWYLAGIQQS